MKKWVFTVAIAYGLILAALFLPLWIVAFYPVDTVSLKAVLKDIYASWYLWGCIGVLVISQALLLLVPVRVASKRPVTRGSILPLILTASFMFGLLAVGLAFAVVETLFKGDSNFSSDVFIWTEGFLIWFLWGLIFYRWSKKSEPRLLLEKQCRALFKGSIFELLIAVPAHILARHRDYCCAGMGTFIGIALGISVMIFSFGPGVFFLLAEKVKRLQRQD